MNRLRLLAPVVFLMAALPLPGHSREAPANQCKYEHLGSLPLRYHGGSLVLVTDGEINGSPATMRLNFSSTTLLTRFGVDRRNLRPNWGRGWVGGAGGDSRLYTVNIKDFAIGPIRSGRAGALRMIDEMPDRPDYDAIVGGDFLLQRDLEVSLAEKKISWYQPDKCRDAFLAYWDANAVRLPLETWRDGSAPTFEVQLDGLKLNARIDPGSTHSYVALPALRKLGLSASSPGMNPAADSSGVGSNLIRNYRYRFKKFSMAHETIENPELIVSARGSDDHDMVLGADFLRAHRVLLARSQDKIYLSYVGGTPFVIGTAQEWVAREAEQGNGYAQYRMAALKKRAKKADESAAWLAKAVEQSNAPALRLRAAELQQAGKTAHAVPLLERAIAQDPFDVQAQLHLFRARVQAGQAEQARTGLAEALKRSQDERWPAPLADYYLGKLSLDELLKEAASDKDVAKRRQCQAYAALGQLLEARGEGAGAGEWKTRASAECRGSMAAAP